MSVYLSRDEEDHGGTKQIIASEKTPDYTPEAIVGRLIDEGYQDIRIDRLGLVFGTGEEYGRPDLDNHIVVYNSWQQDGAVITATNKRKTLFA